MNAIKKITIWGMVLNIILAVTKLTVGILAHSQACVADAVHSMSDFVTDIAVLIGVHFWSAPADSSHPHGHQRIEALITTFIGILLAISAVGMVINAIESMGETNAAIPGWPVTGIAVLSIVTKEVLYQWTMSVGRACRSAAVMANAWHHRSDALSSIPVVIVGIASRFWPEITYFDPIATIIVSCMLLHTSWLIAWPSLKELSDEGVGAADLEQMRTIASSIPGILDVHELRTRLIGGGVVLDMHVLVKKDMTVENGHRICEEAADAIKHKMPMVLDVMTHLEPMNSVNLEAEIECIARNVPGVKDVHSIRVRSVLSGFDADLHVVVDADLSVAEGHRICGMVKKAILDSDLKIVGALIHLEPYNVIQK